MHRSSIEGGAIVLPDGTILHLDNFAPIQQECVKPRLLLRGFNPLIGTSIYWHIDLAY